MRKKDAFAVSLLVTLLILGNYLFFYDFSSGREKAVIARAIDGDTVELDDGRRVRLLNINTPEKGEYGSEDALEFLQGYEGGVVELEINGVEKYGRLLGNLYSDKYLNLEIVRLGLAHYFLVEDDKLEDFQEVQEQAFNRGSGIWTRSEYYGCLDVEINKYDEYVDIVVKCDGDLSGWTLKDESTRKYKFGDVGGNNVRVYSSKGVDEKGELYWGRGNVWNDDKDSIFIRDKQGLLVYYDSYGY